jgi:hypothetical protein
MIFIITCASLVAVPLRLLVDASFPELCCDDWS